MNDDECQQVCRTRNEERNPVTPGPLKHVAHDGGDEQTPDRAGHSADPTAGAGNMSEVNVNRLAENP